MSPRPRHAAWLLCLLAGLAACTRAPVRPPPPAAVPAAPTATRGEFTIAAAKLDTWNAVGQIVVRTPEVVYEGRAQMLDLYSIRYRGEPLLLFTRALLLSETVRDATTLVTAATAAGKPVDSPAAAELLALLQRELPAEIARVRAAQAEERKAALAPARKHRRKK